MVKYGQTLAKYSILKYDFKFSNNLIVKIIVNIIEIRVWMEIDKEKWEELRVGIAIIF